MPADHPYWDVYRHILPFLIRQDTKSPLSIQRAFRLVSSEVSTAVVIASGRAAVILSRASSRAAVIAARR